MNILNFTAIDFETSGLNFRTDRIIEACVVRVREGEITSIFNTLVQFDGELHPKVTEITGHTFEDLQHGMHEEQLAQVLDGLIPEDELVVAYNGMFDLSFLDSLFLRVGYASIQDSVNFIDPLTIARDRHSYPHKLGDMCKRYDIPLEDAHTAHDDTLALVELVLAMYQEDWDKGYTKSVRWYVNRAGYKRKYGEPEWYPKNALLYPQGAKPDIVHQTKPKNVVPKYNPVVVNNKAKRKPKPRATPQEIAEGTDSLLPPIAPALKNALDALIDGMVTVGGTKDRRLQKGMEKGNIAVPSICVSEAEFQTAWKYLTEDKGVPEHLLGSDFDGDVIIEYMGELGAVYK